MNTKSKHADKIAALQADERGEEIQAQRKRGSGDWNECDCPSWDFSAYDYRPKPKRKFVPWDFETCPVGTVIKSKNYPNTRYLIVGFNDCGDVLFANTCQRASVVFTDYEQLSGQPCGVEVEE